MELAGLEPATFWVRFTTKGSNPHEHWGNEPSECSYCPLVRGSAYHKLATSQVFGLAHVAILELPRVIKREVRSRPVATPVDCQAELLGLCEGTSGLLAVHALRVVQDDLRGLERPVGANGAVVTDLQ